MSGADMPNQGGPSLLPVPPVQRVEAVRSLKKRVEAYGDIKNRSELHAWALEIEATAFRTESSQQGYQKNISGAIKGLEKKLIRIRRKKEQEEIGRQLLVPWQTIPKQDLEMMTFEKDLIAAYSTSRMPAFRNLEAVAEDIILPNLELQDEVRQYWENIDALPPKLQCLAPIGALDKESIDIAAGPAESSQGTHEGKGKHEQRQSIIDYDKQKIKPGNRNRANGRGTKAAKKGS